MGYSPWVCKESDTAEQLTLQISPTGASSHTHTHTHTHTQTSKYEGPSSFFSLLFSSVYLVLY